MTRHYSEGLHTLLSVQPNFEVVAEATNGEETLRLAAIHNRVLFQWICACR